MASPSWSALEQAAGELTAKLREVQRLVGQADKDSPGWELLGHLTEALNVSNDIASRLRETVLPQITASAAETGERELKDLERKLGLSGEEDRGEPGADGATKPVAPLVTPPVRGGSAERMVEEAEEAEEPPRNP